MSDDVEHQISVNVFTGVFLLLTGVAVFFLNQDSVVALILILIGCFFLTRSLAQWRSASEYTE